MKRVLVSISIALITLLTTPPANAESSSFVLLSEPSHRGLDGVFFDDELATALKPQERLGALVYAGPKVSRSWIVDTALLDEVIAMIDGYEVAQPLDKSKKNSKREVLPGEGSSIAKAWLAALKTSVRRDPISVLPYGSPATSWLKDAAPSELKFYVSESVSRGAQFFGRSVTSVITYPGQPKVNIPRVVQDNYKLIRKQIAAFSNVLPLETIINYRLGIAGLTNPNLNRSELIALDEIYNSDFLRFENKLRLIVGKYRVTSEREKIPVTLVNDFDVELKVKLVVTPLNGKVIATPIPDLTLAPNSKLQVEIPIRVMASGSTTLLTQIKSETGVLLKKPVQLPLTLSVISPITTWFTTGSAIILLLAGVVQSVRRIKRKRV